MSQRIDKPWGWYEILAEGRGWWVKRLTISPGEETSFQYHLKRYETLVAVSGTAILKIETFKPWLNPTDVSKEYTTVTLRAGHGPEVVWVAQKHQLLNVSQTPVEIIEFACGELDEADIVRLADKYGRAAMSASDA